MVAALTKSTPFTAQFVADACGGALRGSGSARTVTTDTRGDVVDGLFIALRGPTHDGHDYVEAALDAGATGLLVESLPAESTLPESCFAVVVDDTRRALASLARAWRMRQSATVVAITGSCGKTSTKEMAKWIFGDAREVIASEKSFNNDIGVPLTLLRIQDSTEVVLVEVGTNAPGEIEALTKIASPDIALVTMIGRGHLQGLGDLEGVLREKSAILEHAAPDAVAILNSDDAAYARLVEASGDRRVVSYGITHEAQVRARSLRPVRAPGSDGTGIASSFDLEIEGEARGSVTLRRPGSHDVRNLLASIAIGLELEISLDSMLERVALLPPTPRRLEVKQTATGVRVLDDSYNANPESLLAALSVLDRIRDAKRRILVLGDMRELGEQSGALHEELGVAAVGRADIVISVGDLAAIAARAFARASGEDKIVIEFRDVDALIPELPALFGPGDLVLFKGSRAMQLDRAVDAMTQGIG